MVASVRVVRADRAWPRSEREGQFNWALQMGLVSSNPFVILDGTPLETDKPPYVPLARFEKLLMRSALGWLGGP